MGVDEHRENAIRRAGCAVLTVSDTRTDPTIGAGPGSRSCSRAPVTKCCATRSFPTIRCAFAKRCSRCSPIPTIQAIFLSGGTGIAPRDTTFEAVRALFDKEIEGFGELFRALSYREIGAAAMLSRATAGIVSGKIVFSMPGSTAAVELAMQKLALPELGHALRLLEG